MSPESMVGAVGIYPGALVIGAVSSIVPIISIEVFLVARAIAGRIGHAVTYVGMDHVVGACSVSR